MLVFQHNLHSVRIRTKTRVTKAKSPETKQVGGPLATTFIIVLKLISSALLPVADRINHSLKVSSAKFLEASALKKALFTASLYPSKSFCFIQFIVAFLFSTLIELKCKMASFWKDSDGTVFRQKFTSGKSKNIEYSELKNLN